MPTRSIAVAPHHTHRGISGRVATRFGTGPDRSVSALELDAQYDAGELSCGTV